MANNNAKDPRATQQGVSRRGFFGTLGDGVVGTAVAGTVAAVPAAQAAPATLPTVTLLVNERQHELQVEPRWSLLYVLREKLGLIGSKPGCERGECGACTILIDGQARYACMTLAVEAEGRRITTVEGLMRGEELGPVQQAFVAEDAFQCGFCTPGQVVAAEALLRSNASPTIEEIRIGMSGNLCRCGAYHHIVKAVGRAAGARAKGAAR